MQFLFNLNFQLFQDSFYLFPRYSDEEKEEGKSGEENKKEKDKDEWEKSAIFWETFMFSVIFEEILSDFLPDISISLLP